MLGNFEEILKIFDENSIEKLNFFIFYFYLLYVGNFFLLKIDPWEITPFFYNNFFGFGGGRFSPFPLATPLRTIGLSVRIFICERFFTIQISITF